MDFSAVTTAQAKHLAVLHSTGCDVQDQHKPLPQLTLDKLPDIITSHPDIISININIGMNNIPKQQSYLLKCDFTHLFNILKPLNVKIYISGPIPTFGRGRGV